MAKMRLLASLVSLVLFLCMAHPCVTASCREMVVVFKGDQTEVPFEEDSGKIIIRKPRAFRIPAFVGRIFNGKEFLVLLCDARYNGPLDHGLIEPAARTSYGGYTKWSDAEIVVKNTRKSPAYSVVGDTTAVMKGDKIYVLAPSWDASYITWVKQKDGTVWDLSMIVGTVMNHTESKGDAGVFVKWEKKGSLKSLLPTTVLGAKGVQFIGGVGNGVVTKNDAIIFPIQIANKEGHYASSIMYSTDDGSTWHMGGTIANRTSEGSVAEWGNGKLLLSTRYDGEARRAFESADMGTTWKESLMFSRVWGNQPDRKGPGCQGSLITAPVDGEDVLLFSHPLNKGGNYSRDTLQLWMSDGQRILCVGTISEDGKGERSGYSILAHVGDHLYVVHEINPFGGGISYNAALKEWDRVIALSPLSDLFESVKTTVRAWRRLDEELKNISVPTNGLVGFMAGVNDDTVWEDKYNCVNATVNSATRVPGGFRFDDTQGSGAQWPVQSQGQNQVYIFTEKQFTLAATVTIHSTKEAGDHLLLGASMDAAGTKVLMGIGYTQDKKWYALHSAGVKLPTEVSIELEKEYHVAITFADGVVSVYVDGVAIISGQKLPDNTTSIDHFFMGSVGKSSTAKGCLCTVKSVMLFNRVLNQTEVTGIQKLGKYVNQNELVTATEPTVAVEDSETTSTMEPEIILKDSEATSTMEPEIILKDSEATSTMEPTIILKDSEVTSTMEPTIILKDSEVTSTMEPTIILKDSEVTSTMEPTIILKDSEVTSTMEPTIILKDSEVTSTMEPTIILKDSEVTSTMEPTIILKDSEVTSTMEPTIILKDSEATSTMEPKETKSVGSRRIPNEDINDIAEKKDLITSTSSTETPMLYNKSRERDYGDVQNHSNRRDFNKTNKRADGALWSISFTAWMYLVYSAIVLGGL